MLVTLDNNNLHTVAQVKEQLNKYIGRKLILNYNLGRNKFEEYEVIIKELYNYVFIVELLDVNAPVLKSFSYTDVITKTLLLKKTNK